MGCMTSNNWLDFRDDPDQHADTGFLHGIFTNTSGEILQIMLVTRVVLNEFLRIFLRGGMSHQQRHSTLVLIWITIRIQNFLQEFLPLWDKGNCKNFVSNL